MLTFVRRLTKANMAKRSDRPQRNTKKSPAIDAESVVTQARRAQRPAIEPRTEAQAIYRNIIQTRDLIFAIGPAGTGKTYMPTALAADALADKRTSQVIITRPAVEAGESLGFLPGELDEKFQPYLKPLEKVFVDRMGRGAYDCALKNGKIEPSPLAFMRGETFNDCWVILDEAQNVSPEQMKMFLTRIGEDCKVIVCGDTDQVDVNESGLADAVARCAHIDGVAVMEFGLEDVMRSRLCKAILETYRRPSRSGSR
jgi:phosphate starvation-inducible PhoH-like protein